MGAMPPKDSWNEWSRHVLSELRRLGDEMKSIRSESLETERKIIETMTTLRVEISDLKASARVWGALAGVIAGAVANGLMELVSALIKK